MRQFSDAHSHRASWLDPDIAADTVFVKALVQSGIFYIVFVDSPAGPHCLVHRCGQLAHDPLCLPGRVYGDPFLYVLFEGTPSDVEAATDVR